MTDTTTPALELLERATSEPEPALELRWLSPATAGRHLSSGRPDNRPILSIRASVAEREADGFISDALHDVRVYMQEHRVQPAGAPFSIRLPRDGAIDIEAGWPTARPFPGTGRIHCCALPRSLLEHETAWSLP
jgi:hypothetical protein